MPIMLIVNVPTASSAFSAVFLDGRVITKHLENPQASQVLLFREPSKKSERFFAQQGYFSLTVNALGVHDSLIEEGCAEAKRSAQQKMFHEKWIIPSELKLDFLRKLRAMNIAAHSLFPGIDGFGRSLGEVARLAVVVRTDAV